MKFTITAQDLKRALSTCNEVAPVSSVVAEERTGVLIQASENKIVFMSSDDTSAVSIAVPAEVQDAGEALVRCVAVTSSVAASFEDLGFDGEPNLVKVETTEKQTLKLTGKNRRREDKSHPVTRNFPLLNVGFFAETPNFDPSKSTQFPAFQFMDGLAKVSHAASRDASKLHFNCIALTLTDNEAIFAATDGIQIAEFRKAAEVKGLRGSFILGLKFASVAAKLVNPGKFDTVDVYVEDEQFFLKSGRTVLVGTLINTAFPEYQPYMKTEGMSLAVFPREDFLTFLQGLQPTVDAKSHRMVVEAKKGGKAILYSSSITGESKDEDLDVVTPEDFVLHFDSTLLQNAVRQLRGDEFDFYFTPDATGVLLKAPKDNDFKAFVCTLKRVD
jgi:DNA polymerase III sliding clamp (beta) subunit (PCNA family)